MRSPDVTGMTEGELERTRRELAASLTLARPDSPIRAPIETQLLAIDTQLAERGRPKMRTWEEARRNELAGMFPDYDIWYVRRYCQHTAWCCRPKGTPVATIERDSADQLQAALAMELADRERPTS
jgi:hypothetical protein